MRGIIFRLNSSLLAHLCGIWLMLLLLELLKRRRVIKLIMFLQGQTKPKVLENKNYKEGMKKE